MSEDVSGFTFSGRREMQKMLDDAAQKNNTELMKSFNRIFTEIEKLHSENRELHKEIKTLKDEVADLKKTVAPTTAIVKNRFNK